MNSYSSYSQKTPNLGKKHDFFVPCDLEIWQMTLKNNRAHLLCYFKLCATFCSHCWIQTGVAVRKHPIWAKIEDLLAGWPSIWRMTFRNNRAPLVSNIKLCASFHCHICEFQLELQSGNGSIGFWPLWPWPLTSDLDLLHGLHICYWQ